MNPRTKEYSRQSAGAFQPEGESPRNEIKRFTLFGNRLYFWLLLPWVLGGLFFFPYLAFYEFNAKEIFGVVVALVFFLWCAFILLAAVLPHRFSWLIYLVTGSLSLGSVWYFYDSYFVHGGSFSKNPEALHALDLYGVHFLIFSIAGIRSAMKQRKSAPLV